MRVTKVKQKFCVSRSNKSSIVSLDFCERARLTIDLKVIDGFGKSLHEFQNWELLATK